MPQTNQETIESILKEIANMKKIMKGKKKIDIEKNLTLERAVSMTLSLIGEKAGKVTPTFKKQHPEIEWRKIIALRNRIVHNYEDLDFDIIYDIVSKKLPALAKQLKML
jgi:uncharacterized protein with HEPN domain